MVCVVGSVTIIASSQPSSQFVPNFNGAFVGGPDRTPLAGDHMPFSQGHVKQAGGFKAIPNFGGTDETRYKCC